jgi:LuxR family maltose regulon positive regulatory protein
MAYQVLTTKLYNPPRKSGLVQRPALIQRLEEGYKAGKRVTLVSAPAGFGKTTIVCEWITTPGYQKPFGWISLDDADNDPVRFLIYLVSAVQKVNKELGTSILASLQSSQAPVPTDLVEILINEISGETTHFLIVLDDYHLIRKIEVHSLVQLLLSRQPENLHLVIITREDPPLPLPRMRVLGQITEVRERDLRFTLEEAEMFLGKTMGLHLSAEDVSQLEDRTEGWAAGMQLAALALEEYGNESERRDFIQAFAGSNRWIVDYLISEVLQRQPIATQQFLLRSSILERFCPELCDHVVFGEATAGRSQSIMESLEQGNMFLVPLDDQRIWYRYHHLFGEMLWHSLRRSMPETIPSLHRSASEWFEAKRFIPESMKHALSSNDWDFVCAMLDRHALPMMIQGYSNLVIQWCHELPKAIMEKAPNICIYNAWALVLTFRNDFLDAIEEKLQIAGRAIEKPDLPAMAQVGEGGTWVVYKDWVKGQICVIRSQILLARFNTYVDPQELIDLSLKGLELLPEVEHTFRSTCKINLAIARLMQNNAAGAQKPLEEALTSALEAENILGVVTIIVYQARLAFYTGELDRAETLLRQWKVRFSEMAWTPLEGGHTALEIPATRGIDVIQGMLLLERNQLDAAEKLLLHALESLGWASWIELHGFITLARLQYLRGNDAGYQETFHRMARLGPQQAACAEAYQVWYALQRSPDEPTVRSKAKKWAHQHFPRQDSRFALGIGPYHCDTEYMCNLAWARIQIALGHPDDASIFVQPALANAKEEGLAFRVIELTIAQTLIDERLDNSAEAITDLEMALDIAERYGYFQVFDDCSDLDRLLQQAAARNIHASFAKELLAAFNRLHVSKKSVGSTLPVEKKMISLVDPLSEREVEVLRHLAMGLSQAEVAKRLFLSPFTLKAHTRNIYSKLDVHSLVEAINKARDLGLI